MKIAIISGLYPPYTRGGAEWVAADQAHDLKEAGNDIFVITTQPWNGRASCVPHVTLDEGIHVYRFFPLNIFSYYYIGNHIFIVRVLWHLIDIINFYAAWRVKNIVRFEKPDVVITHNCKGLSFLLPRMLRKLGIKHFHTLHDVHLVVPTGLLPVGKTESNLMRFYSFVTRLLFGSPDVVRAPSQWLLDFYASRGFFKHSRQEVIQHEAPRLMDHPNNIHSEVSGVRVLYVGQVEQHKGIIFLLDVWKQLIKEYAHKDLILECAGTGSLLDELKVTWDGEERVVFHGFTTRDALTRLYKRAHVVVVPSLVYENAPTVITEAHAFGAPVIATRAGGIPEMVQGGDILIEAGDMEGLKRAIKGFIDKMNLS